MGTQPFTPKGEESHPIFGPHLLWPNGAWIKMPLGTEVELGLRDIVFDVDPATPRKKGHTNPHPILAHVYCGQMAGWMKTILGTEVDLGPGHIVLDGISAPAKGAQQPPYFWPMCIVATVAHLSYY